MRTVGITIIVVMVLAEGAEGGGWREIGEERERERGGRRVFGR